MKKVLDMPTTNQLEIEYKKEQYKFKYIKILKNTIYRLIIVVAIAVLVSNFLFPVLRIYGSSMEPTLTSKDIVVSIKKSKFQSGDVIAFYYHNRILVKRVIATASDWVNIDKDGNVFVNDRLLEEEYLKEKSSDKSDIEFPYQVPEGAYFVLGDERKISIDSRSSLIGAIYDEDVLGKVIFRVWPIKKIGMIE